MKNNKGVSLIALVVTIVVMIILASIALNSATIDQVKAEEARRLAENSQVEQAIAVRYGKYLQNSVHNPLLGDKIPEEYVTVNDIKEYLLDTLTTQGNINNFETRESISAELDSFLIKNYSEMEYTRILHHNDIIGLDIDNISVGSIFIINYSTGMVVGPIA